MTSLDSAVVRPYLQRADLKGLFNELGWDRHVGHVDVEMEDQSYRITAVAEKRGVQIYECAPCPDGRIPERPLRQKIHTMLAKSAHEHLIVFVDAPRQNQVWQWVLRQPGHAAAYREHAYRKGYADEALIQKLNGITFSLDEEDALTLTGVTVRVKDAFDKDPVTKRFYDLFKKEHDAFQGFLDGIPDGEMQLLYVSVMLNRLMFIYFIQKKGFLDGDLDYLCHRLDESERRGRDRFYLDLLCPLFFQGFAEREAERTPAARSLLGRIPYLNGGLFQRHQIEELHGQSISIPDAAFRRLFDFFDGYQWHLDDRPLQKANEINPDVLGYIFEKYINQKEMGAYYSKEDITGYISRNTVVPFL